MHTDPLSALAGTIDPISAINELGDWDVFDAQPPAPAPLPEPTGVLHEDPLAVLSHPRKRGRPLSSADEERSGPQVQQDLLLPPPPPRVPEPQATSKNKSCVIRSLQEFDDQVCCAVSFAAHLDNISNKAASEMLRTLLPNLLQCAGASELTKQVGALLERRSIDRSRAYVAAVGLHVHQNSIEAIRTWNVEHPLFAHALSRMKEPARSKQTCAAIIDWMWDETHQCLQDNPGHETLAHLPLTHEYLQALRRGGILAARSVAMSVMVQLGGLSIFGKFYRVNFGYLSIEVRSKGNDS